MDNDIKLVFGLISYFLLITFIITMVTAIASDFNLSDNTGYTQTGGTDVTTYVNGYADGPRFGDKDDFDRARQDRSPLPLGSYGYITDQASCESYNGFVWDVAWTWPNWLPFVGGAGVGDLTCRGGLDITYYANGVDFDDGSGLGSYTNDPICELALLDTSKDLALSMGCSWYSGNPNDIDFSDTGKGNFKAVFEALKDISTLRVDFGFENGFLNFMVNFFVILLPAIVLLVNAIFAIRRIVGFN
jgi:hypothetical protein